MTVGRSPIGVAFGILWNGSVVRVNVAFGILQTITKRLDLTSGSSPGFRLRPHNRRDPNPRRDRQYGTKKKSVRAGASNWKKGVSFSANLCAEVWQDLAEFGWDIDVNLSKRVEAVSGLENMCGTISVHPFFVLWRAQCGALTRLCCPRGALAMVELLCSVAFFQPEPLSE